MRIKLILLNKELEPAKIDGFDTGRSHCHERILQAWDEMKTNDYYLGMDLTENPLMIEGEILTFYLKTLKILKCRVVLLNKENNITEDITEATVLALRAADYQNASVFYFYWNLIRYMVRLWSIEYKDETMNGSYKQGNEMIQHLHNIKTKHPKWQSIKCLFLAHFMYDKDLKQQTASIAKYVEKAKDGAIDIGIAQAVSMNLRELKVSSSYSIIGYDDIISLNSNQYPFRMKAKKMIDMDAFNAKAAEIGAQSYPSQFLKTESKELDRDQEYEASKITTWISEKNYLKLKKFFDNDF